TPSDVEAVLIRITKHNGTFQELAIQCFVPLPLYRGHGHGNRAVRHRLVREHNHSVRAPLLARREENSGSPINLPFFVGTEMTLRLHKAPSQKAGSFYIAESPPRWHNRCDETTKYMGLARSTAGLDI